MGWKPEKCLVVPLPFNYAGYYAIPYPRYKRLKYLMTRRKVVGTKFTSSSDTQDFFLHTCIMFLYFVTNLFIEASYLNHFKIQIDNLKKALAIKETERVPFSSKLKENVPTMGSSSKQAADLTPPRFRRLSLETPTFTRIPLISKSPASRPLLSSNAPNKELDKNALSQVKFPIQCQISRVLTARPYLTFVWSILWIPFNFLIFYF